MDGADLAALRSLPGVLVAGELAAGADLQLDDDTAHHLRVRRLEPGTPLRVTDGAGTLGRATLLSINKRGGEVRLEEVGRVPPPLPILLLVPVADRDRMLWLAEKATELGLREWTPVRWTRSRSVTPRGEGDGFRAKVRARMVGALLQSGGAWMPVVNRECDLADLLTDEGAAGVRVVLHGGAPALWTLDDVVARPARPVTVALGPEGGLEGGELDALIAAGFRPAGLGELILRFETAGIAALAILRARRGTGPDAA